MRLGAGYKEDKALGKTSDRFKEKVRKHQSRTQVTQATQSHMNFSGRLGVPFGELLQVLALKPSNFQLDLDALQVELIAVSQLATPPSPQSLRAKFPRKLKVQKVQKVQSFQEVQSDRQRNTF